ncbi:tyrosine-type recombinase/integrase [Lysinibacillus sp. FSL K6-0102]|uniref:tyrosine-type recombinase/integrase n=1 Tax=Lysinibacillus sp. FSL K6-0102 TaxID=2975290 RepID=UPI0030F9C20B
MVALNTVKMENYIGDHIEAFLNEYKSNSIHSYKSYKSSLNKLFKDTLDKGDFKFITVSDIEGMTVHVLKEYFNTLHEEVNSEDEPKHKNSTINKHISVIKKFIEFLAAWDIISYDVNKLSLLKFFPDTREEIEMIPFDLAMKYSTYFRGEDQGLEKQLIIKLAIETALRATELLELKWSNFTVVEDGVIMKSHGSKKGKGNKEWIDKINKELYEELLQLKSLGNENKLFTLTYKQLTGMMDRGNELLNDTGVKYSFHSFKKLAVTMCYLNNNNCIDTAMKKARHSNVNTTMRYLRLTNLNVTGIISAKLNTEDEVYKTVSHELLLEALSEMRPEMLLLLNNKIKNKKNNM